MRYIFEDKEDDILSRFMQRAYNPEYIENKFIYANGGGNLESRIDGAINSGEREIYVYIDIVPDNPNTINLYHKLISKYKYMDSIIFIPIPCSEYYVIQSLIGSAVIRKGNEVLQAIDIIKFRGYYKDSEFIQTDKDRVFCKNFEKFCKLFLMKAVLDCANTSRSFNEGSIINKQYEKYYTNNCVCTDSNLDCVDISLDNKLRKLLSSYPCFPAKSIIPGTNTLTRNDIIVLHRRLIDDYNKVLEIYKEKDRSHKIKYIQGRYMPWVY